MDGPVISPPPTPKIMDYPGTVGIFVGVLLTSILLFIVQRYDHTSGTLTISLLVIFAFYATLTVCLFYNIPNDEITSGVIGGLVAAFGAVVAYWLGRPHNKN